MRDRYRAFQQEMMNHIEAAPNHFQSDSDELPECIVVLTCEGLREAFA